RILVIELWNIGDIVLAMPFLAQLRALFPQAKITMLARPYARTILAGTDLVDEFIDTELGWSETSVRHNPFAYHWLELVRVRRELKRGRFDLAFSSRMHVREYVVLALSGAGRRVAFSLGSGERVLTDAIPPGNPNRHKTADWLELLKPFGGPVRQDQSRLKASEVEQRWAREFLAAHGVSTEARLVAIHPGASVPEKRWPLERFVEVAAAVAQMPDTKVLAFIAPDGYGERLSDVRGVITAKVNLRELIALVECCDVLVCNDSGPMHIAGAVGVPTVSIFGSGINRWFSPLGDRHRLLTAATANRSPGDPDAVMPYDVAGISTSDVLDAVSDVLGAHAEVHP
ncbi:MAG TPA: glycosyltransferase family 9 protein, partial [Gemmatimonadaceae bacterium]|nr:glycosyltransferase family 9 protein [Gemmatimonadaceae bacterium]